MKAGAEGGRTPTRHAPQLPHDGGGDQPAQPVERRLVGAPDGLEGAQPAALTQGESSSLLVSSPLRRAAATVAIALSDRLRRSSEKVALNSSCQEISRNFDTMALAPKGAAPRLALPDPSLRLSFDAAANAGNKSTSTPGYSRLMSFAQWASERPESTLIIGGHSLWFRSFFQCFLPPTVDHVSKKRKIVNCGVVGLTLQVLRDYHGQLHYRVDPSSIAVVYGGFDSK